MNSVEIISKLESIVTKEAFGYGDMQNPLPEIGGWECVDEVGGEGQGDHTHTVIYFKDHDIYIKLNGFYSSFDGRDYTGYVYHEVKPVEKTIIVYDQI